MCMGSKLDVLVMFHVIYRTRTMENIAYIAGPFVFAILFAVSFAFWDWYRKRQDDSGDISAQLAQADEDEEPISFDKLMSQNDSDILSGATDKYTWTQNDKEVEIYVSVETSVRGKDVQCIIDSENLVVMVRGEVLLEGSFYAPVVPDECNWQIGNNRL